MTLSKNIFRHSSILLLSLLLSAIVIVHCNVIHYNRFLYGEDSTWINAYLTGDLLGGLLSRGTFYVFGVTIPQLLVFSISPDLNAYIEFKTLASSIILVVLASSFFLNPYLTPLFRILMFALMLIPLTSDIQVEVFGHLHNLVWFYPIATANLCMLLLSETEKIRLGGLKSARWLPIAILSASFTGILFPLCAIVNIVYSVVTLRLLIRGFFRVKELSYILRFSIIINMVFNLIVLFLAISADRVVSAGGANLSLISLPDQVMQFLEFIIRQVFGIGIYLFSYLSLSSTYYSLGLLFLGLLCLTTAFSVNGVTLNSGCPNRNSPQLSFLWMLSFSLLIVSFAMRYRELSVFLDGLGGPGYPNRYYITTSYLFTLSYLATASQARNYLAREDDSKLVYYSWIGVLCSLLFLKILLSLFSSSEYAAPSFRAERSIITQCNPNTINVKAYPREFITQIPRAHRWYFHLTC